MICPYKVFRPWTRKSVELMRHGAKACGEGKVSGSKMVEIFCTRIAAIH